MQLRLPPDKLVVARQKLQSLYRRKKASLHDIRSLLGTLAFACRTVVAGRCFLRRLYDLTRGIHRSHHLIRFTQEARKDLGMWKLFLDNFNDASLCLPNTWTSSAFGCIPMPVGLALQLFCVVVCLRGPSLLLGHLSALRLGYYCLASSLFGCGPPFWLAHASYSCVII